MPSWHRQARVKKVRPSSPLRFQSNGCAMVSQDQQAMARYSIAVCRFDFRVRLSCLVRSSIKNPALLSGGVSGWVELDSLVPVSSR